VVNIFHASAGSVIASFGRSSALLALKTWLIQPISTSDWLTCTVLSAFVRTQTHEFTFGIGEEYPRGSTLKVDHRY
jgi:hypothetical protein